ncbi:MAG TPA: PHB depolymerase family esterase, partial [Candidatus Nanopelagicales bacterium]|nr:PHB depolymerase family esterase [Candidatus Nanopelagicales bacterium]
MKSRINARACALIACAFIVGSGCSSSGDGDGTQPDSVEPAPTTPPPEPPPDPMAGRTYRVVTPSGYDGTTPAPLVVMVHQMWAAETAPEDMDEYLGITVEAEKRGAIVAMPLGTYDDLLGAYMWNATDACCGYYSKPDDVGFIAGMLAEIKTDYNIDEKRVFGIGQSNGGFMVHRLACDFSAQFAAIASLSGGVFKDPQRCLALDRVAVLHVHGTADDQVS